jgi:hypothetical protein
MNSLFVPGCDDVKEVHNLSALKREGRENLMAIKKRKTLPINAIKRKRISLESVDNCLLIMCILQIVVANKNGELLCHTSTTTTKANDIFEFTPRSDLDSQTNLCTLDRDENQQSPPKTKWHVINAEKCCREPLILQQLCCCCCCRGIDEGRKLN